MSQANTEETLSERLQKSIEITLDCYCGKCQYVTATLMSAQKEIERLEEALDGAGEMIMGEDR